MKKPEHITDKIRDFLKGRLSAFEAEEFRKQMQQDPELEDQVAFTKLMISGLGELEKKDQKKIRTGKVILAIIFVALAILSTYLIIGNYKGKESNEPDQPPEVHRVNDGTLLENTSSAIQGGGQSVEVSDRANSISWNSMNEVVICGQFVGPSSFGGIELTGIGEVDMFLAANSFRNGYVWAKQIGTPKDGTVTCTTLTIDQNDNIIVTGSVSDESVIEHRRIKAVGNDNLGKSDFYVAKFDPTGSLIWIDHNGGDTIIHDQTGNNLGRAVVTDQDDNILAAGNYIGHPTMGGITLPDGGPNEDAYFVKYDPSGKLMWVTFATSDYMVTPRDVAVDLQGNAFITGSFGHHNLSGKAYFNTEVLNSFGGRDIFLAKYSTSGDLLWVRQAGGTKIGGNDQALNLSVDGKGNCLVTGRYEENSEFGKVKLHSTGGFEMFLAKYNQDGDVVWAVSGGGPGDDNGSAVLTDKLDNIYCTGHFTGLATFGSVKVTSQGKEDIYIAKYDADGQLIWLRQMGGDSAQWNTDRATELSINSKGQLVVTGSFSGKMKIGQQTLESEGREDIFAVFFDSDGNLLNSKLLFFQT